MQSESHLKSVLISLFFILVVGVGLYLFLSGLIEKVNSMQSDLGKTLVTSAATILVAVITLAGGKLWEQRIRVREEIRAKKIPIYEEHVRIYFRLFSGAMTGKKSPSQEELVKAFTSFTESLVIWGSCDVIKAWGNFRRAQFNATDPQKNLEMLEDFLRALRKDTGNEVRCLRKGDLLRMFVNDYDEAQTKNSKLV